MSAPKRIQLSRKKGFRLPENAVNVARPSKWGNPFIVGKHGTRAECVWQFRMLCGGFQSLGVDDKCNAAQLEFLKYARLNIHKLRGKDLACWCHLDGKPCHADVLIGAAQKSPIWTN